MSKYLRVKNQANNCLNKMFYHHSNNRSRLDSMMSAKINGQNVKEKKDIGRVSRYLPLKCLSVIVMVSTCI